MIPSEAAAGSARGPKTITRTMAVAMYGFTASGPDKARVEDSGSKNFLPSSLMALEDSGERGIS